MSEFEFLDLLPKREVPSLEYFILETVASAAKRFAKYSIPKLHEKFCENKELCESVVKDMITSSRNNLISRIPYQLYDHVCSKILGQLTSGWNVYNKEFKALIAREFWMLKIHPHKTSLVIGSIKEFMRVKDITSSNFDCLTTLDISSTLFTDTMLSLISKYCVEIRHLMLWNLTASSILILKRFQYLEMLEVRNTISDILLAELLMENPTLKQLELNIVSSDLMEILNIIQTKGYTKALDIEEGLFTIGCQNDLNLIAAMCPKLKKINLYVYNDGYDTDDEEGTTFYPNLAILGNLTNVVDILFSRIRNMSACHFDKFLAHAGKNITHLYLKTIMLKSGEMILMGKNCPSLKYLDFDCCTFANDDQALQDYRDQIKKPMFANLEILKVRSSSCLDVFKIILTKTYNIKHVFIGAGVTFITEKELQIILIKNPMAKLQSFQCPCVINFETLIRNCKYLKRFSTLNIDDAPIASGIKKYIQRNNIDFDYR